MEWNPKAYHNVRPVERPPSAAADGSKFLLRCIVICEHTWWPERVAQVVVAFRRSAERGSGGEAGNFPGKVGRLICSASLDGIFVHSSISRRAQTTSPGVCHIQGSPWLRGRGALAYGFDLRTIEQNRVAARHDGT